MEAAANKHRKTLVPVLSLLLLAGTLGAQTPQGSRELPGEEPRRSTWGFGGTVVWWYSQFGSDWYVVDAYPAGLHGWIDLNVGSSVFVIIELGYYDLLISPDLDHWLSIWGLGVEFQRWLSDRIAMQAAFTGGYAYDELYGISPPGHEQLMRANGTWYLRAQAGLSLPLGPSFSFEPTATLAYIHPRWAPGICTGISYSRRPGMKNPLQVGLVSCEEALPVQVASGVKLPGVEVELVNWFPFGTTVREVELEVFAPGYMQQPLRVGVEGVLKAKQRRRVQVELPLGVEVLEVQEGREVPVEVKARYRYGMFSKEAQGSGLMHVCVPRLK
jgi:hypothetical protein